ncbi:MAG: type II secretion system secretin GspD [Candidatus Sulfopaludibacter sp.]|nr:type II secretion system secretin GspD [Candidatus Sulfopaludibacter sp.]
MKIRLFLVTACAGLALAQTPPAQAPPVQATPPQAAPAQPTPSQTPPAQPAPAPAPTPAVQTAPAQPAQTPPPQQALPAPGPSEREFMFEDVSLAEMIDTLAKRLKINYILDKRVVGTVTIHTYGEVKPVDYMPLLMTILRINQATMVKVGDLYRIVPTASVSNLPVDPLTNGDPKTMPDDERMVLNLVFLKYATATEIQKLIHPFMGEGGTDSVYEPANLLLIQDNSRNMKRTMELIGMFDSDTFAGQRVKLFDVNNSRPGDLVKDLDNVFKAYSLSEKNAAVHFIPVDRINTIIAVAPNPGIFTQVQAWIDKLDIPVKTTAGSVNNYVYRLKYGNAINVAMAIMALYSGNPMALIGMAASANSSMYAAGIGMNGTGAMGGGGMGIGGLGMGGGMGMGGYGGGMGMGGYGMGGYGGGGYGGGGYGTGGYGGGGYGNYGGASMFGNYGAGGAQPAGTTPVGGATAGAAGPGLTGSYLGNNPSGMAMPPNMPHVIPNPFDNTLLIQGTAQDYEQLKSLLRQLDVAPMQVLIEAKIYEVDLTNNFAMGVESALQQKTQSPAQYNGGPGGTVGASRVLAATGGAGGLSLTTGLLVSQSKELLALITASENRSKSKLVSAPSIIATDSVAATMNVGSEDPVLTSQGIAGGVQSGGSSVFTNTVTNQSSGITLSILAHVNSSGIVTMVINQQVSAPIAPAASAAIQSPSFSNRSFSTQVTVQDGDMIAIGGAIQETHTESSGGIPILDRIPFIGAAFGSKNITTDRKELIVFMTPRVIYDTTQILDATEEIKVNLKRVGRLMKDNNQ